MSFWVLWTWLSSTSFIGKEVFLFHDKKNFYRSFHRINHVFLRSVGLFESFSNQEVFLSSWSLSSPTQKSFNLSLSKFKRSSRDERRLSRLYAVSTWAILQSLSELFEVVFHSLEIKSFCLPRNNNCTMTTRRLHCSIYGSRGDE